MSDVVSDLMNTIDELNIKNNDLKKENTELKAALIIEERIVQRVQRESKELYEFKSFVNMMVRRSLNHTCSDYEALMSINEKLIKEQGE